MAKVAEKVYFKYSVIVRREGNEYTSWCPELDVASSGKSVEEACKNLRDAVECFVETYSDLGELNDMFKERGITLNKESECPQIFLSEGSLHVPAAA